MRPSSLSSRLDALFAPIPNASLAAFRIAFGLLMTWEVTRFFSKGWIERYYLEPTFFFTYTGFGWVQPWPGVGMYLHFAAMGVLALMIAVGWHYRLAAAGFGLGLAYVFLLDQTNHLNHFYLIIILCAWMAALPAHGCWSVDAWRSACVRSETAPRWTLLALQAQLVLVYFYAGVAKLNADWLAGEPMGLWMAARTDVPLIGMWFAEPWMPLLFSWGGALFDLLIGPLLLWRRTRIPAALVGVGFHLANVQLFSIGVFPWLMIAATTLFFDPDWPERLGARFGLRRRRARGAEPVPPLSAGHRAIPVLLMTVFLVQALIPLRHHLYPGNPAWTEEGHRFSWRMKLRSKRAEASFRVTDVETGETWRLDPADFLTRRQASKMPSRPPMIHAFAQHLAREYATLGREVEVRADVVASLNGRPYQRLIDPEADLAQATFSWRASPWILPLDPTLTLRRSEPRPTLAAEFDDGD